MKTAIRISKVIEITNKRVKVILADTGDELWLPLSQAERFGDRIFIPDWLARRYKRYYEHTIEKPVPGM